MLWIYQKIITVKFKKRDTLIRLRSNGKEKEIVKMLMF